MRGGERRVRDAPNQVWGWTSPPYGEPAFRSSAHSPTANARRHIISAAQLQPRAGRKIFTELTIVCGRAIGYPGPDFPGNRCAIQ